MIKLMTLSFILLVVSVVAIFSGLVGRSRRLAFLNFLGDKGVIPSSVLTRLLERLASAKEAGQSKHTELFDDPTFGPLPEAEPDEGRESSAPLDMDALNCRVRMVELREGDAVLDAFAVEICGSIHAPDCAQSATLKISILDITDESAEPMPVRSRNPRGLPSGESARSEFCYSAELGRLPRQITTLDNWTSVAKLRTDGQEFCRRGERTLRFEISVLSAENDQELADAWCTLVYDNPLPGYADLKENAERTRVLAVALAFAVSAADGKLYDCEIELIKDWARDNILDAREKTSGQSSGKLEKALSTTVAFFKEGNKLDTRKLCEEIVGIASLGQRYEVLELSMRVAQASGKVSQEEMATLKSFALWLEVDGEKFRTMMERILPVDMHEVMDVEDLLGITSDMSRERTRKHLNKEYSKWNSRVTSADPDIQTQADQMLRIIAEARGQYVTTD